MALLTISGDPASRYEETAQAVARLLHFELISEARLGRDAAASIVGRLAARHHLVVAVPRTEALFAPMPMVLRAAIIAGEGRGSIAGEDFDIVLNSAHLDPAQMAEILCAAAAARGLMEQGFLADPAGSALSKSIAFGHPSEEVFANLLDFYRIRWEYEPRSFPLQWDKGGRVIEAFTPDFYLPDEDLYIELTTMKQALVTRKNRKIRMLKAVYPHINVQVLYQRDIQDLIFKYGVQAS
ncbi:MAG TPA: hypothetical protein VIY49_36640 [Bryobacteraceae bacterium]